MADKPLIVVTRKLPESVERRMTELFGARLNPTDMPMSRAQLVDAVRSADVLVPTVTDSIDAALIGEAGERLRLIANFGNGVDNIDLPAAAAKRIIVTNTPGVLTEDTADITMALILAVPRRIIDGARVLIAQGSWPGWSPTWMLGHRLGGRQLGIIGMGRIGQAVARRARAFGLSIHYHNRHPVDADTEAALAATYWESLDEMLARIDIVSINTPHTTATHHLLDARRLRLMKAGSFVVNTARGSLVDEKALIAEIVGGHIAGAGLDVFEGEPSVDPALLELARTGKVVILPHMGSATVEGRVQMGEKVIINIRTFFDGHKPPNCVLPGSL